MDLKILFTSDSGFRRKFNLTLVILTFALVIYSLFVFLNVNVNLFNLEKNIYYKLIIFSLLIIPIFLIKFIRWRFICSQIDLDIPFGVDAKCWIESQAFLATPGGSGLGVRAILLKEKFNLPFSQVIPAIIFERLNDLLSVFFIILIMNIRSFFVSKFIIPILIVSIIIYSFKSIKLPYRKFARFIPSSLYLNEIFIDVIKKLLKPKKIFFTIIIGSIPWLIEGYSFFLILRMIGDIDITWNIATFSHLTATVLGALSFLPGGIGATEAGTIGLLTLSDVPFNISSTSTIFIRLLTIWLSTLIGIFTLCLPNKQRNSSF